MELALNTDKMIARKEDGIGWIIFNNPARRNAVSLEMWEGVQQIVADYAADDDVRVAVLAGAGDKAFVSGADISEFEEKRNSAEAEELYRSVSVGAQRSLVGFEKPIIAMIRGYCVGGGVAVALTADIRIAGDDAQFAIPAARLGLGYNYPGLKTLTDLVGPAMAKEIFFTARRFKAAEAAAMGLVNRVVPVAELDATVRDYARMIAENAPLTIRAAKAAVREALKDESQRDIDGVERLVKACFDSADYAEGRRAFMEKRKPEFKGR
ncbi:MAG TPA: enoyl-CoA hydratase [Alphaproteobacteria bacterium]|nr:enoyl-CoA hydratase [Alphaproteobacteria bacterium]